MFDKILIQMKILFGIGRHFILAVTINAISPYPHTLNSTVHWISNWFFINKNPLCRLFFSIKLLMALTTSQIYTKLGKPCCKIEIWEGVKHMNPKEYSFVSITYSDVGPLTTTLLHFWELKPNKIAKANFSKITKCSLNPLFKLCEIFGQSTLTETLEALLSFSNGFPMKTSWENLPKPSFWLVASISAD